MSDFVERLNATREELLGIKAWRDVFSHDWRDPEEKFTFAVCAVALVIVIAKVWFE